MNFGPHVVHMDTNMPCVSIHFIKGNYADGAIKILNSFPTWNINHFSDDSRSHQYATQGYLTRSPLATGTVTSRSSHWGAVLSEPRVRVIEKLSLTTVMYLSTMQSAWFHKKLSMFKWTRCVLAKAFKKRGLILFVGVWLSQVYETRSSYLFIHCMYKYITAMNISEA